MLQLPKLPYSLHKYKQETVAMRSINFSDSYQDGDLADSLNISAKRYPYITTRKARDKQERYQNATAMTAWEKLVVVQGEDLLYDGQIVGTVTPGEKQFAVVNTKLVIWPDKVYLDLNSRTVKPLGAAARGTGATFTTNTMTVTSYWPDLTTQFKVGDAVSIGGSRTEANNKSVVITALTANSLTVTDNAFTAVTDSGVELTIERKIPDMDYICESENRLWGCSNDTQTIYASSLGDPTNFFVYSGSTTDSYAVAVGTEGRFTGCCKLSSSILFWKETKLHKMLGSYPAEYSLYTYDVEGLRAGCHKSMQVINETLFYMGIHGVYAYSGGTPSLISANFGSREFSDAVGGNDGDSYYMSAKEGDRKRLFVYEVRSGVWVLEDEIYCTDFARIGRGLYMLTDAGDIYSTESAKDDPNIEWLVQSKPFYETIQGRKSHSKMILRVELPAGSYIEASVRYDGRRWVEVGKIVGENENAVPMRIPLKRCDKFEIRLNGQGPCTILGMVREFSVGSEV